MMFSKPSLTTADKIILIALPVLIFSAIFSARLARAEMLTAPFAMVMALYLWPHVASWCRTPFDCIHAEMWCFVCASMPVIAVEEILRPGMFPQRAAFHSDPPWVGALGLVGAVMLAAFVMKLMLDKGARAEARQFWQRYARRSTP